MRGQDERPGPGAQGRRSRRLLSALGSRPVRIACTVGLLAALALLIDWRLVAERLAAGRWGAFAAGVAVLVVALLCGAERWHALLRASGLEVSRGAAYRASFAGVFANGFLPTGFGGDAVRTLLVARGGPALARAAASVIADRVSALGCLLALGVAAVAAGPATVPAALAIPLLGCAAGAGAVGVVVLVAARGGARTRALARRLPGPLLEGARVLAGYAADRRLLARTAGLGLLYQGGTVGCVYLTAESLRLDIDPRVLAAAVPLVVLLTLLPISIAGFGVREGGFAATLATVGVVPAEATTLSLLTVAALAIAGAPGALVLLLERRTGPSLPSPPRSSPSPEAPLR